MDITLCCHGNHMIALPPPGRVRELVNEVMDTLRLKDVREIFFYCFQPHLCVSLIFLLISTSLSLSFFTLSLSLSSFPIPFSLPPASPSHTHVQLLNLSCHPSPLPSLHIPQWSWNQVIRRQNVIV